MRREIKFLVVYSIMLLFCVASCRTNNDGGVDLTYTIRTYNKNGSYNSLDIEGYIFFLVVIAIFYCGGKWGKDDRTIKFLMYILFGLLFLLPLAALLPK